MDNEAIARRIASYKLPVWTGIGHEIDISILDHVSNRSFKTPTAVAEEIIARFVEMKRHLEESKNRFQSTWSYRVDVDKKWITDAKTGIKQGTRKLLDNIKRDLKNSANLLSKKVTERLTNEQTKLSVSKKMLYTVPLNLTKRMQDRLKNKTGNFLNSCAKQISDRRKDLLSIRKRFRPDRYFQRVYMDKKWIADAKIGIRQGSRKLLAITISDLKNVASLFSLKVKERILNEKTKLSVFKKMLCTAPLNLTEKMEDRLEINKTNFQNSSIRQISDKRKDLQIIRKRFHRERYFLSIYKENDHIESLKEQLMGKFFTELNNNKKEVIYFKKRFKKEIIMNRIQKEKTHIFAKYSTLKASDPKTSLKRGFSLAYKTDGTLVKSINQLSLKDILKTEVSDGLVLSTINEFERK